MISWYRFLDWLQSTWNTFRKTLAGRRKWGSQWRDKVRSGRRYSRVEFSPIGFDHGEIDIAIALNLYAAYRIRTEPGWEWTCQNCKTHSLVTDSMIAIYTIDGTEYRDNMFQQWAQLAADTRGRGFKPPEAPTPATASCPNCKYRPGAPE